MSKSDCEYYLVERLSLEQLKAIGCQWINGDKSGLMTDLLTDRVRVPSEGCLKPKAP